MGREDQNYATCTAVEPFHFADLNVHQITEAVGSPEWFWRPGQILKIHFLNGDDALKRQVAEIASEWMQYANLRFSFYYKEPPLRFRRIQTGLHTSIKVPVGLGTDIAITFWDNGGGKSFVGSYSRQISQAGQPSMHLPKSGNKRVVLHEFGHALGLQHEHQNPAHGIQWNAQAVYKYYKDNYDWSKEDVDENVLNKLSKDNTNFTSFDSKSIMLYPIPAQLTTNGYSTSWNTELSATDKSFIASAYPR